MKWIWPQYSRHHRYSELSDSIREHLDEKIADLMDRGMSREQAESAARRHGQVEVRDGGTAAKAFGQATGLDDERCSCHENKLRAPPAR